jgi:hypothetical protein
MTPFHQLLLLSRPQRRFDRDLTEISPFRRRFDKRTSTNHKPPVYRDPKPPPQTRIRQLIKAVESRSTP